MLLVFEAQLQGFCVENKTNKQMNDEAKISKYELMSWGFEYHDVMRQDGNS